METRTWAECRLSHLMLGTVQLGMPYGIANRTGRPDYRRACAILAAAAEGGVNCLDTAAAYGDSEEVLGRALQELGLAERMTVVTKLRPLAPAEAADARLAARAIEQSVTDSRRRLQLDCLPIVLVHRESEASHVGTLERLKDKGWLRHAGVSCDNRPAAAVGLAANPSVSALQIPANLLDRRHLQSGVLSAAETHGVAVFIRSVYLQGFLLMAEEAVPEHLRAAIPIRRRLEAIAANAGMSLAELAVRYMLGWRGVTCVLAGVETEQQVRANIAVFNRGPLAADVRQAVDEVAPDLPEAVVTPWMWPAPVAKTEERT